MPTLSPRRSLQVGRVVIVVALTTCAGTACGRFASSSSEPTAGPNPTSMDGGSTSDAQSTSTALGDAASSADADGVVRIDGGKLAWVYSTGVDGDEVDSAGLRADAQCSAELGRPAFAWVTTQGAGPLERNPSAKGPWADADRVLIAETPAILRDGPLKSGIHLTKDGVAVTGQIWTGVTKAGAPGQDCNAWKSQTADGIVGLLGATDGKWTEDETAVCQGSRPFLCFEL